MFLINFFGGFLISTIILILELFAIGGELPNVLRWIARVLIPSFNLSDGLTNMMRREMITFAEGELELLTAWDNRVSGWAFKFLVF